MHGYIVRGTPHCPLIDWTWAWNCLSCSNWTTKPWKQQDPGWGYTTPKIMDSNFQLFFAFFCTLQNRWGRGVFTTPKTDSAFPKLPFPTCWRAVGRRLWTAFSKWTCPKDHWTLKTGVVLRTKNPLRHTGSFTLPLEGPRSLACFVFRWHLDVSENSGTPKSSILIGFSIIFTIHFEVPLFLETPICFDWTWGRNWMNFGARWLGEELGTLRVHRSWVW